MRIGNKREIRSKLFQLSNFNFPKLTNLPKQNVILIFFQNTIFLKYYFFIKKVYLQIIFIKYFSSFKINSYYVTKHLKYSFKFSHY